MLLAGPSGACVLLGVAWVDAAVGEDDRLALRTCACVRVYVCMGVHMQLACVW